MANAFKCKQCEKLFPNKTDASKHLCRPEIIKVSIKGSEFCKLFSHDWRVRSFKELSVETRQTHSNPKWDGPGGYESSHLIHPTQVSIGVYKVTAVCKYCAEKKTVKKESEYAPKKGGNL